MRVRLTFPRSGQQLKVHVPRKWALAEEAQIRGAAPWRTESSSYSSRNAVEDHPARKP